MQTTSACAPAATMLVAAGFEGYITKPTDIRDFSQRLRQALASEALSG